LCWFGVIHDGDAPSEEGKGACTGGMIVLRPVELVAFFSAVLLKRWHCKFARRHSSANLA